MSTPGILQPVIARLIPAFFLPLAIAVLAPDRAQGQFTGKQGDGVISIVRTNYHGWPDSIVLGNQLVEVVIVPAIGRVMQFRWKGDKDGPFWENPAFEGKSPDPKSSEWGNFGGDKTWPAPQADWPKVTPRTWPPPPAFDSMAVEAKIRSWSGPFLTSPIDPYYGIRTRRVITPMDGWRPLMSIQTTFEKVAGEPSRVCGLDHYATQRSSGSVCASAIALHFSKRLHSHLQGSTAGPEG